MAFHFYLIYMSIPILYLLQKKKQWIYFIIWTILIRFHFLFEQNLYVRVIIIYFSILEEHTTWYEEW